MSLEEMTAIAVTYGPGLVGALLVGVAEAKALAYAAKKPLVGVHHIEGHVSANFIENPDLEPPFMCLIVSGGHTHLVIMANLRFWDAPETMQQARPLTRWHARSGSVIRAARRSIRRQKRGIHMRLSFHGQKWATIHMISASAA